jgi:hypothetical protein
LDLRGAARGVEVVTVQPMVDSDEAALDVAARYLGEDVTRERSVLSLPRKGQRIS